MKYEDFMAKYKLKVGVLTAVVPGVGILPAQEVRMNRNQIRRTISIHGPNHQYMYILYIDSEYCVGIYSGELRRLGSLVSDETRKPRLEFLNSLLADFKVPIEYIHNAKHHLIVLRNKITGIWGFNLEYTYKTPGFNDASDFIQVEAMPWQVPGRPGSNSLEGRFDPDKEYRDDHINEAAKLITENLA